MNFASDNTAAIAPGIMDALVRANDGFALGYGNDDLTRAVERRIGGAVRDATPRCSWFRPGRPPMPCRWRM